MAKFKTVNQETVIPYKESQMTPVKNTGNGEQRVVDFIKKQQRKDRNYNYDDFLFNEIICSRRCANLNVSRQVGEFWFETLERATKPKTKLPFVSGCTPKDPNANRGMVGTNEGATISQKEFDELYNPGF